MADVRDVPEWLRTPAQTPVSRDSPVPDAESAAALYGEYAAPAPALEARIRLLLDLVAQGYGTPDAARRAGIPVHQVYAWRRKDDQFRDALERAESCRRDVLEAAALERAVRGVEEPVYYQGAVVGYRRVYSDQLLTLLLKAHAPEKYKDRSEVQQHVSGDLPPTVVLPAEMTIEQWQRTYLDAERVDEEGPDAG